MPSKHPDIVSRLQADILRLQGFKWSDRITTDLGLGRINEAFPNATFPLGAIHEFLPDGKENVAAMNGFMAGLLASLMGSNGASLWVSASRTLFPPALKSFGIQPDRLIFVDMPKEQEVLWAMEEALKCGALAVVVGEVQDLGFTASRRLQLAVEQSGVTGFVVRRPLSKLNPTACVSRWKVTSLPSESPGGLPGIGFPQWRVELLRVRNGKPGAWEVKWVKGGFRTVCASSQNALPVTDGKRKTG